MQINYGELIANGADGVIYKKEDIVSKVQFITQEEEENTFNSNNHLQIKHPFIVPVNL